MIELKDLVYGLRHNNLNTSLYKGTIIEYLKELEYLYDLQKQGRLITMPCSIDDNVVGFCYTDNNANQICAEIITKEKAKSRLKELMGETER